MTFGVKLHGELRYRDEASATAAHAAMMNRDDDAMLTEAAVLSGSTIRFSFDGFLPVANAEAVIGATEAGIEKALETANSGSVVIGDQTGFEKTMTALGRSFWQSRWKQGQTAFHEGKPNALLVAHVGRIERAPKQRILVPLAGKADDLRFLAARGHEVVGVEFVLSAIGEYFAADDVDLADVRQELGPHPAFTRDGVTLVHADMLDVGPEALGRFDAIYDRAALVALEPSTRARYVETCRALLHEGAPTLLVAFSYDRVIEGPPWSIDRSVVDALFAGRSIELLSSHAAAVSPGLSAAGVTAVEESAYLIGA